MQTMTPVKENLQTDFQEAKKLVDRHQRIILVSHEYTDGDDLGAMLAFGLVLKSQGKMVWEVALGGVPDNLLFLPGQSDVHDELPENLEDYKLLITLGCGTLARAGFLGLENWKQEILNIDHHADTQMFGTVNVWDEHAAANCELVYFMLREWDAAIDKLSAQNLLTGIFTDTGGFRHANVSAVTFEVAAELLRRGANLELISRFTFSQKELPKLRAWSIALENARFDRNRKMVYTVITSNELKKVGAKEEDLEGITELLNTIPEASFSMLLKQQGDQIKGSLRSETHKGVDVSQIARAFGGGGHKLAAGFKFKGIIEKTDEGWKIT